jgi:hypothetical protein
VTEAVLRAALAASSEALQRLLLPHDDGNIFLKSAPEPVAMRRHIRRRPAAHVQPLCRRSWQVN